METRVIPFEYESKKVRVVQDEDGLPWFVAKDVCVILGLVNPTEAVRNLDEDEKNTLRISEGIDSENGQPGNPNVNVISESGLYTLIIRSNKEAAKPFRRWVTHEVLPSIRKTGQYVAPDGEAAAEQARMEAISQLMELLGSVNSAVRGMAAAYGDAPADSLPGRGPTTSFGVRSVSLSLRMKDETVREFLETCCLLHPDASCRPMELYDAYQGFCQTARMSALGRNTFYKSLREIAVKMVFTSQSVPDENGGITCIRVVYGICLNRTGRYYAVAWEGGAQ